jgi:hypothetical protein
VDDPDLDDTPGKIDNSNLVSYCHLLTVKEGPKNPKLQKIPTGKTSF